MPNLQALVYTTPSTEGSPEDLWLFSLPKTVAQEDVQKVE
jgi:hypothetical protein